MSRIAPHACDRCGQMLTYYNRKLIPVHHPSPYVDVCFACWNEIERDEKESPKDHRGTKAQRQNAD
jgi:hypothetical protein